MPSIAVSVDIQAPIGEVWELAADLANHGEWMSDVASIEFEPGPREGLGAMMRVATRVGPFQTTDLLAVTAWEPMQRIEVEHRGLVTGRGEFLISPVAGATRVTWTEDLRFPWQLGGSITAALAVPFLTRIWRMNLARLKARLETRD